MKNNIFQGLIQLSSWFLSLNDKQTDKKLFKK